MADEIVGSMVESVPIEITHKEAISISEDNRKSILLSQPPEIRNQIYRYLLDLKHCDRSIDSRGVEIHHFSPNILRTCKAIYIEAHGILYADNGPVVTVVCYFSKALEALQSGLVSHFPTRYTRSISGRQLHLAIRPTFVAPREREPVGLVLTGTSYLKAFSRFLKLWNYAFNDGRGISYDFSFEAYDNVLHSIEPAPEYTLQVHRQLVGGFAGLRASVQTATCKGLLDENLEKLLMSKLNNQIIWLRVETWEYYKLALAKYNQAANCWVRGDLDRAIMIYKYLNKLSTGVMRNNPLLYDSFCASAADLVNRDLVRLGFFCHYNILLARVIGFHRGTIKYPANEAGIPKERVFAGCYEAARAMATAPQPLTPGLHRLAKWVKVELWLLMAFLCGHLGYSVDAPLEFYTEALAISSESNRQRIEESIAIVEKVSEGGPKAKLNESTLEELFGKIRQNPAPISPLADIKSATVVNERYILKCLKYNGPIYEKQIQPLVINYTDPNTGDEMTAGDKIDQHLCRGILDNVDRERSDPCKNEFSIWVTPVDCQFRGSCEHMRKDGRPSAAAALPFQIPADLLFPIGFPPFPPS
ncbi:hypothetical protein ABW19_dt0206962 [Dactylella cylindrospora]|nr:hypothetical protein ABW19_dt0206962 [Dactylella cylindrospora]